MPDKKRSAAYCACAKLNREPDNRTDTDAPA